MALTSKQEKFAQEWFATGNKSEAYRRSYNAKNSSEHTINCKAHALSRKAEIKARYDELAKAAQERNEISVDLLTAMLRKAYAVAASDIKPGAMVAAAMGLVKLHGMDVETQHRIKTEGDGKMQGMVDVMRELAKRLPD